MHQEDSQFYSSEQVSNLKMAFFLFLKLFHMIILQSTVLQYISSTIRKYISLIVSVVANFLCKRDFKTDVMNLLANKLYSIPVVFTK